MCLTDNITESMSFMLGETEKMSSITAQTDFNIAYLYYYRGDYPRTETTTNECK
jgi:hypothetical protein